jgi:hypothetical protein
MLEVIGLPFALGETARPKTTTERRQNYSANRPK